MSHRINVLIADDSAVVRKNLRKLLADHPAVASLSESAGVQSTIQHLDREHPDTVIIDLQLPDGSGFEILEHLRFKPHRPVTIVLTNFPDQSNRERAIALGADHFFDKSFEYEQLVQVLGTNTTGRTE